MKIVVYLQTVGTCMKIATNSKSGSALLITAYASSSSYDLSPAPKTIFAGQLPCLMGTSSIGFCYQFTMNRFIFHGSYGHFYDRQHKHFREIIFYKHHFGGKILFEWGFWIFSVSKALSSSTLLTKRSISINSFMFRRSICFCTCTQNRETAKNQFI